MTTDLPFPTMTGEAPTLEEVRRARTVLREVLRSTVGPSVVESAFIAGAVATLTWVLGDADSGDLS